jgi:hypothetical protein
MHAKENMTRNTVMKKLNDNKNTVRLTSIDHPQIEGAYLKIARCEFHFSCLHLVLCLVKDQTQPLDLFLAQQMAEI